MNTPKLHLCDCGRSVTAVYNVGNTKWCDVCAPTLSRQIRKMLMSIPISDTDHS